MSNSKFVKISQMPPAPPAPPAGGAPPMGMPPMGAPPIGVGATNTQPMSSPPDRQEITTELDTLGKILYDADITEQIENESGSDADELTMKLWTQYGGDVKGSVDPGKVGERTDKPLQGDEAKNEKEATEDQRWKRLPKGKTIADITDLDEIRNVMNGLAMGTIKNTAKEQGGGAPPPGGGMPMASATNHTIRLAEILDSNGYYDDVDFLDTLLGGRKLNP